MVKGCQPIHLDYCVMEKVVIFLFNQKSVFIPHPLHCKQQRKISAQNYPSVGVGKNITIFQWSKYFSKYLWISSLLKFTRFLVRICHGLLRQFASQKHFLFWEKTCISRECSNKDLYVKTRLQQSRRYISSGIDLISFS